MNAGITIRDELPGDIPAIHELHCLAFNGSAEANLVDELRRSGEAVISLVAVQETKITGHILFSRIIAPMPALSLAPLAVHPDFQRRGIGSSLVRAGLERARETGWSSAFVLGDPAYYGLFGFGIEAAKPFTCPYSGNHFMALHLTRSPPPTGGPLIYPKAFEALD